MMQFCFLICFPSVRWVQEALAAFVGKAGSEVGKNQQVVKFYWCFLEGATKLQGIGEYSQISSLRTALIKTLSSMKPLRSNQLA